MSFQRSNWRNWIAANWKKYDPQTDKERLVSDVAKRFHIQSPRNIKDMLVEMRKVGELPSNAFVGRPGPEPTLYTPSKIKLNKPFRMSIDVDEVKKDFDEDAKIEEGLASLGTHLIKDVDFRIELGITSPRWKIVSKKPKYDKNKKELKGKRFYGLYWGQVATINELSKKIDMM